MHLVTRSPAWQEEVDGENRADDEGDHRVPKEREWYHPIAHHILFALQRSLTRLIDGVRHRVQNDEDQRHNKWQGAKEGSEPVRFSPLRMFTKIFRGIVAISIVATA